MDTGKANENNKEETDLDIDNIENILEVVQEDIIEDIPQVVKGIYNIEVPVDINIKIDLDQDQDQDQIQNLLQIDQVHKEKAPLQKEKAPQKESKKRDKE